MCGIIGISEPQTDLPDSGISSESAAYEAYHGLLTLQHRGQDAAGIVSYDDHHMMFSQEKDMGLVAQVFGQRELEKLTGRMVLGHNRYATAGTDGAQDIQPLVTGTPFGLAMVHNGNILNYHDVARELTRDFKRQLLTSNDLEILMHLWNAYLIDGNSVTPESFAFDNICQATKKVFDKAIGGYAVIGMISGIGMIAFRDPKGIRPLILGHKLSETGEDVYCLCSETVALNYLGYDYVRDIAAGEVVLIDRDGKMQSRVLIRQDQPAAPCMFEWVYFSAAESSMEDQSVYTARLNLGVQLAEKARQDIKDGLISPDVVMPVPDTSRSAAISLADELKLPYREGLIKNRYVHRSFILNTQEKREKAVELKLSPVRSEITGKSILLVDDSIVRGTTAKRIVALLKKYGAKEIVLGITCPPLRDSCFYGIDFPDPTDLLAHQKTIEEISDWMGVKRIIYLEPDDLRKAIGLKDLCMACVTSKYPTDITAGVKFSQMRQKTRDQGRRALFENTKEAGAKTA
ncbi:MAG: amidophosphoribosyltransferase [Pseudomonadota bacterium]